MIAIVGGGIIGLSIGWMLARRGADVTVFDKGAAGREASWAAAGMLAPQVEAEPGEEWFLQFLLKSRALWQGFAEELEAASGIAVDYRGEGTLVVALDHDDAERLRFQYDFQCHLGLDLKWLSGREARALEPHLSPSVVAGVYSQLDHQVDNRKVMAALTRAFGAAGGTLREHAAVEAIRIEDGRVKGLRLEAGSFEAEQVVVAAGAWSRGIEGLPEAARPPVRPVKGQMLALRMEKDAPLLRHVVWGPAIYLIPRRDGTLLLGATVEEMGFDTGLTAGGQLDLLRAAWETLPGIYDLPVIETWAGLRPGSRDDAPILGPSGVKGLTLATGHHRNGILLAPITAMTIARYVASGELAQEIEPFSIRRFTRHPKGASPP
jgi:glycine oxidase